MLKKEIFNLLMNNVESQLIQDWNMHFQNLDSDNTGTIKIKELVKLIQKTRQFESQLKKLKALNKRDPNLKINYSDFLLRIVDIKREIKHEDIANAFIHLDTDGSGKIDVKDLQSFLRRRGDDISEEEAFAMIKQANKKISSLSVEFKDKKTNCESDEQMENYDGPQELDYRMFKMYLCAASPESQSREFLTGQSSLRFSEYISSSKDANSNIEDKSSKFVPTNRMMNNKEN
jgi:Ca2+-binding EF-hand superfamily protein